MSGNVYCFWKGGTPPSPWAKKTTWDGRYCKLNSSVSSHGTTGGAATHVHTGLSNWSISYSATVGSSTSTGSRTTMLLSHIHSSPSSVTTTSANNDPSYYTLELIYTDYDTWENTNRTLPAGAVILSQATISWSSISRFTAADGRLIKLGTAGSTGGRDEHSHTASGTVPAGGSSIAVGNTSTYDQTVAVYASHTHTFSIDTASKSIWPLNVRSRLYQVDADTDRIVAGAILFFDSTPSANWEAASSTFNGCFLCPGDSDPAQYNSNSHNHTGLSGTSSSYNAGSGYSWSEESSLYGSVFSHSHNLSFDLNSVSHEPEYVYLVPYRLKTTLLHVNTLEKTYSVDVITKKVQSKTYGASARLRTAHSALYTPDILVKEVNSITYPYDLMLKTVHALTFDTNARLLGRVWAQYQSSISLVYNAAGYGVGLRIVRPYGPNDTVINTLYHSWIDQLDQISRKIDNSVLANRVEYATGLELDSRWGKVLDLPRLLDEDDYQYRKRLQAATKILTGCGTKQNCEETLSFLVGYPDSVNIIQDAPGKIRIYWKTYEACKKSKELSSLINGILPKMVAGGISYSIYQSFADYQMGFSLSGPVATHYDANLLVKKLSIDCEWSIRTSLVLQRVLSYEMGSALKKSIDKGLYADLSLLNNFRKDYQMDLLAVKTMAMSHEIDLILKRLIDKNYNINIILKKMDISKSIFMGLLVKRSRKHDYSVMTSIILRDMSGYGMDIKVV